MMAAHWLEYIRAEWEHPDPWEQANDTNFGSAWQDNNTKFTHEEVQYLTARMDDVRRYLLGAVGSIDQNQASINRGVDAVIAALPHVGRHDWLMMLYGYLLTHVADWSLTREHFAAVLAIILEGVKFLAGHH
jgi:hypothetical protein